MRWRAFLERLFPVTPADCPKRPASSGGAGGGGSMSQPIQMGGAGGSSYATGHSRSHEFNMRLAKDLREIARKLENRR